MENKSIIKDLTLYLSISKNIRYLINYFFCKCIFLAYEDIATLKFEKAKILLDFLEIVKKIVHIPL